MLLISGRFSLVPLFTTILLFASISTLHADRLAPVGAVISQKNTPITIIDYSVGNTPSGVHAGIKHHVQYRNTSDQKIVAVSVGLVAFSAFNSLMGVGGGVSLDSMDPGAESKAGSLWNQSIVGGSASFYLGFVYVDKVRFADGTIWEANTKEVVKRLSVVQRSFKAAHLEKK